MPRRTHNATTKAAPELEGLGARFATPYAHRRVYKPAMHQANVQQVKYRDLIRELESGDVMELDIHIHTCDAISALSIYHKLNI